MLQREHDFFEHVAEYPFLWRFRENTPDNGREWTHVNRKCRFTEHFYDVLDEETMRAIQEGIGHEPTYRKYTHDKTYHFTKKELQIVFHLAAEWMELKGMGRHHYCDELCYVASKIILFQLDLEKNRKKFSHLFQVKK